MQFRQWERLRREAPAHGLARDCVIYDSSDQITLVRQAIKALGYDETQLQPREALSRIRQAKNKMEPPADLRVLGLAGVDPLFPRVTPTATAAPAPPTRARIKAVLPPLPPPLFCWATLVCVIAARADCPWNDATTRI